MGCYWLGCTGWASKGGSDLNVWPSTTWGVGRGRCRYRAATQAAAEAAAAEAKAQAHAREQQRLEEVARRDAMAAKSRKRRQQQGGT